MDAQNFRNLMRNHAGAPVIVAVGVPGARTGLTATAFCSLSDAPPLVLACVNRNASAHDVIVHAGKFSVNMLRQEQADVAMRFAGKGGAKGEDRFDRDWEIGQTGVPLMRSALAALECQLVDVHEHGSHSVFIGRVCHVAVDEMAQPLIYFRGGFGALSSEMATA